MTMMSVGHLLFDCLAFCLIMVFSFNEHHTWCKLKFDMFSYISQNRQRLLTDEAPRLRNALRYTIYGKSGVFDAERFIDVMQAFENFITAAKSGGGEGLNGDMAELGILQNQTGYIIPVLSSSGSQPSRQIQTRAALAFLLSEKGSFFREFLLDEVIQNPTLIFHATTHLVLS